MLKEPHRVCQVAAREVPINFFCPYNARYSCSTKAPHCCAGRGEQPAPCEGSEKAVSFFFPVITTGSALELMACTFCSINSYRLEGRAIRRLVDLAIPLSELISEHDHCVELGAEDEVSANAIQGSIEYVPVTTMSNSGSYPVTPVASQLRSSTPVAHHLLRLRSRWYLSVKYIPWSMLHSLVTTPRRLPCLDVSSPWTRYILYLVAFSSDLTLFSPDLT